MRRVRQRVLLLRALGASLVVILSLGPAQLARSAATNPAADLVLVGGKILTVDQKFSIKEAVAIKDGKFLAVGTNTDMRPYVDPATKVIDLRGRTVLPGLIDSHIHALRAGLTWDVELHWDTIKTLAEGLKMIADRAARTPPGTWILVVGGWHETQFAEGRVPTVADLEAIAPNHPVWVQRLYERAIVNGAAMKALGITAETQNPLGGKVLKDEATGQPTGIVTGAGGINAFYFNIPRPTLEQQIASTRHWFLELNRVGLTAVGDVAGGGQIWPNDYRAVTALRDRRALTLRVRWYLQPNRPGRELEVIRQFISSVPVGSGDDMLKPIGIGEQPLAAVYDGDAYSPIPPVFPRPALEEWRQIVRTIAESGWRLQVHATNNRTAEQLLPAIEEVNREIPLSNRRVAFAHLEDATLETIQRIKAIGGGITVQDRLVFARTEWPAEVARRAPPLRTMLSTGIPMGAGTDSTRVAPYNPFLSLWWLITGKTVSGRQVRESNENLSREQALRLYTTGSAWFSFDEDKLGSIEPGKLADLVVLSADYLTVPVDEVKNLVSVLTLVGGKPTYATPEYRTLFSR